MNTTTNTKPLRGSLAGLVNYAQDWATRAEEFLSRNKIGLDDDNRQKVIQMTCLFLQELEKSGAKSERKSCYVVHSQDRDWRFQTAVRSEAYIRFKRLGQDERVAMFYWTDRGECKKLYASEGYTLSRDY
jgi:hypothetical protein